MANKKNICNDRTFLGRVECHYRLRIRQAKQCEIVREEVQNTAAARSWLGIALRLPDIRWDAGQSAIF